jgi:preprotein translocase subunit SecY
MTTDNRKEALASALLMIEKQFGVQSSFVLGGSSLLIVVSVVLETMRQIQSMAVSRNYDKFL